MTAPAPTAPADRRANAAHRALTEPVFVYATGDAHVYMAVSSTGTLWWWAALAVVARHGLAAAPDRYRLFHAADGRLRCECPAGAGGQLCKHVMWLAFALWCQERAPWAWLDNPLAPMERGRDTDYEERKR